jgi:hypothetical protein
MKLHHIAAAVAFAAAGTAHAAIDNFTTGNGSLFLVAYDNAGGSFTQTASLFDLGFHLEDIAGATGNGTNGAIGALANPGTTVVWNFNNNTVTVDGVTKDLGANSWSTAFNKLVANSDAGQIKWLVGAGDNVGIQSNARYLLTGQPTAAALSTQNASNTSNLTGSNTLFLNSITSKGTLNVDGVDNGAWTFSAAEDGAATAANGYVLDTTVFTPNWKNRNMLTNPVVLDGAQQNLWLADATGAEKRVGDQPLAGAGYLNGAGTLTFNSATGTLTLAIPAVPEPSTYALTLLGLGLVGAIARRRRA